MIDYHKLAEVLFNAVAAGEHLYAILDGARTTDIAWGLQTIKVEHDSLYRGRSEEALWDVAPYLIRCERGAAFLQWVLERGWGNSWGVYFVARASLEELHQHFQQFILVQLADDKNFYFRFYDPRVLRIFLPTCTLEETREFFGPVRCYLVEGQQPHHVIAFVVGQDGVAQQAVPLALVEPARG